jgi:hypothetical protein
LAKYFFLIFLLINKISLSIINNQNNRFISKYYYFRGYFVEFLGGPDENFDSILGDNITSNYYTYIVQTQNQLVVSYE